jgi:hypothetical protein
VKRHLIVAAGLGALTLATATPALASWTQAASSSFSVSAKTGTLGPAGAVTASRDKGSGNKITATFRVTAAPTGAGQTAGEGYRVFNGTTPVCTMGNTVPAECTSYPAESGATTYTIKAYAGTWSGTTFRTCVFLNNDTTSTCS